MIANIFMGALLSIAATASIAGPGPSHGHGHSSPGGKGSVPSRTIDIKMMDSMRFEPSNIAVKKGETIRFRLHNAGNVPHEMMIGSGKDLAAHAEQMKQMSAGGHGSGHGGHHGHMPEGHSGPMGAMLGAGERGEFTYTFDQAGAVDFACLIPGHFEAGMVGKLEVK